MTTTSATSPVFNSGKQICDVLNKKHNEDLKAFAVKLFQQVSSANQAGRQENDVEKDGRFLDAFAQLLTGDEVCAAIAFSGNDILIATNAGSHDERSVAWNCTGTISEQHLPTLTLRLGVTCRLRSNTGNEVSKMSDLFEYRYKMSSEKAELRDQNSLCFRFSRGEFPDLPDEEVSVRLKLTALLERQVFEFLMRCDQGTEIPFGTQPVVTCLGPLKRRAAKLLHLLSFIARSILGPRHLKQQALALLEAHEEWVGLLNDSLTYELSRMRTFAKDISVDPKTPKGLDDLQALYQDLVRNYQSYKERNNVPSSVCAVSTWLDSLQDRCTVSLPSFIRDNYGCFYEVARRYFIQLAVVEEYIKENAEQNGALAQRIRQEHIFKEPDVKLLPGSEDLHAEMRLFSYHLTEGRSCADYYGIAKLCCALCHYTLEQFRASGLHCPKTRGTHATLYPWPIPEALHREDVMQIFLGEELFQKFCDLNTERGLETSKKAKKGPVYPSKDIARAIISRLAGLNSESNLKKLGMDQNLLICGSSDHYATNDIPPQLPISHAQTHVQEDLEAKEQER